MALPSGRWSAFLTRQRYAPHKRRREERGGWES